MVTQVLGLVERPPVTGRELATTKFAVARLITIVRVTPGNLGRSS